MVLKQLGDLKGSQECFEKAIGIDKNYKNGLLNLGIQFQQRGDLEKAGQIFDKVIELDVNFKEALYNKGVILSQ